MNNPHILYTSRPDATPEGELTAVVAAYEYLLKSRESEKAAETSGSEDHARKEINVTRAKLIVPE